MPRTILRAHCMSFHAVQTCITCEAVASAISETTTMSAAFLAGGPCIGAGQLRGAICACPAIFTRTRATRRANAVAAAILRAGEWLHTIMASKTSRALTELPHASPMASAPCWAWLRGVEHCDVAVAFRAQLTASKNEHLATDESCSMPFPRKPRNEVCRPLGPAHVNHVQAPDVIVAHRAHLRHRAAASDDDIITMTNSRMGLSC
mmetsp:Transcript_103806/g.180293  ORF Transcript_103806/g.180293 Transcript_103806/m.180293 type:complete len:206 (-) Transcript_103806:982-1599(-)